MNPPMYEILFVAGDTSLKVLAVVLVAGSIAALTAAAVRRHHDRVMALPAAAHAAPPVHAHRLGLMAASGGVAFVACAVAAAVLVTLLDNHPATQPVMPFSTGRPANIPVLAYHQLDSGCGPAADTCNIPGQPVSYSLSTRQFTSEMSYLHTHGYHSITAFQYAAWVQRKPQALPAQPVLITVDDGIGNFFTNSTPILQKYGFNAVAFIVTGFADGATAGVKPYAGWDATWAQLAALPPGVWSFGFHAGIDGHTARGARGCTLYYPCQLPTESAAQYETRVSGEITAGRRELAARLPGRVNDQLWAVPWDDLAQPGDPTSGATPARWLPAWAADQFPAVFLQDANRNGTQHERYRLEVHGDMTGTMFEHALTADTAAGEFR